MNDPLEPIVAQLGRALDRPLGAEECERLARFAGLVQQWNARTNLTAAKGPVAMVEVLCADALVLADVAIVPEGGHVLDVGTGAGAPAVPLALLRDDLTLTLIEPLRKRVAFLRHAIGSLDLHRRVTVLEQRVDHAGTEPPGGPFDLALSRATLAPAEWVALGGSLAPRVLVLTAAGEPPEAPPGLRMARRTPYKLPSSDAPRTVTLYARG